MSRKLPSRLARRLFIFWLGLKGSLELRLDRSPDGLAQARATFGRLVDVHQQSFLAHYQLGRIAERRRQAVEAIDHYGRAHAIDAERFARVALSADLRRRVLAREALIRAARQRPESQPAEAAAGRRGLPVGDFSSADEYRRFHGRPAISREEIEGTDLDLLLSRLLAED